MVLILPIHTHTQDADGFTLLMRACASGHKDVAMALIEKGASLDSVNGHGFTPLMCASITGIQVPMHNFCFIV
jgi:ankyrin repeat protein